MILNCGTRLRPQTWTAAVQRTQVLAARDWRKSVNGRQIVVDLSAVGFADFVALGQVLVFIDAATAGGALVSVRLPATELLDGESMQDPDAARRRRQRQSCRLFLTHSGFHAAATTGPLRNRPTKIIEKSPTVLARVPQDTRIGSVPQEPPKEPQRPRVIMPYRWLSSEFGNAVAGTPAIEELQDALHDLGLPVEDSAAFAKGILSELLENVAAHAQWPTRSTCALVGAAVIWPQAYAARVDDFVPTLRAFVQRSADVGSPLIRLIVADSGPGVTPTPQEHHGAAQQEILQALDRRVAIDVTEPGGRPSLVGLWKVQHVVRDYQGSVLICTNGVVAGRAFTDARDGTDLVQETPTWLPGTLVECDVLAWPASDALRSDEEVFTPVRQRGDRPHLTCVPIRLAIDGRLDAAATQRIAAAVAEQRTDGQAGIVIVVQIPQASALGETSIRAFLDNVLHVTESVAHATVTVVFPNINRPLLSLAVEAVHVQRDKPSTSESSPILVVAPEHRHYWIGGSRSVRQVLRSMSSMSAPLSLDVLLEKVGSDPPKQAAVRWLLEHTCWVHTVSGVLSLRTRPQDSADAIGDDLAETLARIVAEGNARGVRAGAFLTPNLRVVSRWCSVGDVLADLEAEQLAGFALAERLEGRIGRLDALDQPVLTLAVGYPIHHQLVSTFARCVTGSTRYLNTVQALVTEYGGVQASRPKVVLVTDLINTATTVMETLTELIAHDIDAAAVAARVKIFEAGWLGFC